MKPANDLYFTLAQRYVELSKQADLYTNDHARMLQICEESYQIAKQLIAISSGEVQAIWSQNICDDLLALCGCVFNFHDIEKARGYFEELKTRFASLKFPSDPKLQLRYLDVQEQVQGFEEVLNRDLKPVDKSTEESTFNPTRTWQHDMRNLYGDKGQDHFNQFSLRCVNEAAKRIQQCVDSNGDLQSEFEQLLAWLAQQRQQHAVDTNTKNAELFGRPRLINDGVRCVTTNLDGRYAPCEYDIKDLLMPRLKAYKEKGVTESEYDLQPFTYRVKIIENVEAKRLLTQRAKLTGREQTHATLLLEFIDRYKPEQINGLIISEFCLKLNGEMHTITAHLSTFRIDKPQGEIPNYRDFSQQSLDDFLKNSRVLLGHIGSPEAFEYLITDIRNLFAKAIRWDKSDPQVLNAIAAEMHYKLAHLMHYCRGSAAITEGIVKSVYKYHGCRLVGFKPGVTIDLKGLASPFLKAFIHNYVSYWEENPALARNAPEQSMQSKTVDEPSATVPSPRK